MTDTVRIAQFYPAELGITGDRGNVRALQVRLERAGVAVEVITVGRGDDTPSDLDIAIFGNGPLSAMRAVIDDLRTRTDALRAHVEADGVLLAVGATAELLSSGLTTLEGETIAGLGIFDLSVKRTRDRKVGYIIADTDAGRIIGFEDYASEWTLGAGVTALGTLTAGRGSFARGDARGELVRTRNAFATNVQGPALPLNPWWSDLLAQAALTRRGITADTAAHAGALNDYADGARAAIERLVHEKQFKTIGLA